jgi:hypothetical protein
MKLISKPGLNANLTEAQVIEKFFGDIRRWPVEPDGHNYLQSQIRKVAAHIARTGDCLWHAQAVVLGWPNCHCADISAHLNILTVRWIEVPWR